MTEEQYHKFTTNLPTYNSLPYGSPSVPPSYSIPFNSQCTQWALGVLMEIDILPKIPTQLLPTIPYFNPFFLSGAFGVMDAIGDMFNGAEQTSSPLILDLDGDGIETTGVKDGAYFDHAGDGFSEQTGWVGANDGLLVYDRNGNGRIESGAELFGDNTLLVDGNHAANGFEALAELDDNQDGKIDAQDAAFANLRVWKCPGFHPGEK